MCVSVHVCMYTIIYVSVHVSECVCVYVLHVYLCMQYTNVHV